MAEPGRNHDLMTSGELVQRARAGEVGAVDALIRRYEPRLRAYIHARVPRSARRMWDTQDVAQDVCIKLVAALKDFEVRGLGSFWNFALTLARNRLIDVRRRGDARPEQALPEQSGFAPPDPQPSAADRLVTQEQVDAFDRAVARRPEPLQTAIRLRMDLSIEWQQIADECDFPSAAAARMAVTRALQGIAKEMAHGEADA